MASDNPPPWLANADWRRRELRYVHGIGLLVFVLAAFVSGALALGLLSEVWKHRPSLESGGFVEGTTAWIGMMVFSILLFAPAVGAGYGLWRRIFFGESVCRILTLPGVIGGWFKADIECRLPALADGKVEVWLINRLRSSRDGRHIFDNLERVGLWRMSQTIDVTLTPGARVVIPVRLQVPRDAKQFYRLPDDRPNSWASRLLDDEPAWLLVVRTRGSGMNYLAMFDVPVFDTSEASASEQRAD